MDRRQFANEEYDYPPPTSPPPIGEISSMKKDDTGYLCMRETFAREKKNESMNVHG